MRRSGRSHPFLKVDIVPDDVQVIGQSHVRGEEAVPRNEVAPLHDRVLRNQWLRQFVSPPAVAEGHAEEVAQEILEGSERVNGIDLASYARHQR